MKNPNCDNDKCRSATGEVRVLPSGGDSNLILCLACYIHETDYRRKRNIDLAKENQFQVLYWSELKVYGQEVTTL